MSFLLTDIGAERPVGRSVSHPPSSCVCVYSCVCVRLSDWLTLLTSSIWTIKSAAVLRREGYDGWSFNLAASLPSPLTPTHNPPPRCGVFYILFSRWYLFEEGRRGGVNGKLTVREWTQRGEGRSRVCGGYSALMGLLVSAHTCSCAY